MIPYFHPAFTGQKQKNLFIVYVLLNLYNSSLLSRLLLDLAAKNDVCHWRCDEDRRQSTEYNTQNHCE